MSTAGDEGNGPGDHHDYTTAASAMAVYAKQFSADDRGGGHAQFARHCHVANRCESHRQQQVCPAQWSNDASRADAVGMHAVPAKWSDVLEVLIADLEATALGEGVAWHINKVRAWWDTGAMSAVVVKDGSQLIAYASAMSIRPETFNAITEGSFDPTDLDLRHFDPARTHHWVGIVITDPNHQGKGAGRLALAELVKILNGQCVADVYSEGGRALAEKSGWRKVRDGERPIYVSGRLPTTL